MNESGQKRVIMEKDKIENLLSKRICLEPQKMDALSYEKADAESKKNTTMYLPGDGKYYFNRSSTKFNLAYSESCFDSFFKRIRGSSSACLDAERKPQSKHIASLDSKFNLNMINIKDKNSTTTRPNPLIPSLPVCNKAKESNLSSSSKCTIDISESIADDMECFSKCAQGNMLLKKNINVNSNFLLRQTKMEALFGCNNLKNRAMKRNFYLNKIPCGTKRMINEGSSSKVVQSGSQLHRIVNTKSGQISSCSDALETFKWKPQRWPEQTGKVSSSGTKCNTFLPLCEASTSKFSNINVKFVDKVPQLASRFSGHFNKENSLTLISLKKQFREYIKSGLVMVNRGQSTTEIVYGFDQIQLGAWIKKFAVRYIGTVGMISKCRLTEKETSLNQEQRPRLFEIAPTSGGTNSVIVSSKHDSHVQLHEKCPNMIQKNVLMKVYDTKGQETTKETNGCRTIDVYRTFSYVSKVRKDSEESLKMNNKEARLTEFTSLFSSQFHELSVEPINMTIFLDGDDDEDMIINLDIPKRLNAEKIYSGSLQTTVKSNMNKSKFVGKVDNRENNQACVGSVDNSGGLLAGDGYQVLNKKQKVYTLIKGAFNAKHTEGISESKSLKSLNFEIRLEDVNKLLFCNSSWLLFNSMRTVELVDINRRMHRCLHSCDEMHRVNELDLVANSSILKRKAPAQLIGGKRSRMSGHTPSINYSPKEVPSLQLNDIPASVDSFEARDQTNIKEPSSNKLLNLSSNELQSKTPLKSILFEQDSKVMSSFDKIDSTHNVSKVSSNFIRNANDVRVPMPLTTNDDVLLISDDENHLPLANKDLCRFTCKIVDIEEGNKRQNSPVTAISSEKVAHEDNTFQHYSEVNEGHQLLATVSVPKGIVQKHLDTSEKSSDLKEFTEEKQVTVIESNKIQEGLAFHDSKQCQIVPCETLQHCGHPTPHVPSASNVQENHLPTSPGLNDYQITRSECHKLHCVGNEDNLVGPVNGQLIEELSGDGVYTESSTAKKVVVDLNSETITNFKRINHDSIHNKNKVNSDLITDNNGVTAPILLETALLISEDKKHITPKTRELYGLTCKNTTVISSQKVMQEELDTSKQVSDLKEVIKENQYAVIESEKIQDLNFHESRQYQIVPCETPTPYVPSDLNVPENNSPVIDIGLKDDEVPDTDEQHGLDYARNEEGDIQEYDKIYSENVISFEEVVQESFYTSEQLFDFQENEEQQPSVSTISAKKLDQEELYNSQYSLEVVEERQFSVSDNEPKEIVQENIFKRSELTEANEKQECSSVVGSQEVVEKYLYIPESLPDLPDTNEEDQPSLDKPAKTVQEDACTCEQSNSPEVNKDRQPGAVQVDFFISENKQSRNALYLPQENEKSTTSDSTSIVTAREERFKPLKRISDSEAITELEALLLSSQHPFHTTSANSAKDQDKNCRGSIIRNDVFMCASKDVCFDQQLLSNESAQPNFFSNKSRTKTIPKTAENLHNCTNIENFKADDSCDFEVPSSHSKSNENTLCEDSLINASILPIQNSSLRCKDMADVDNLSLKNVLDQNRPKKNNTGSQLRSQTNNFNPFCSSSYSDFRDLSEFSLRNNDYDIEGDDFIHVIPEEYLSRLPIPLESPLIQSQTVPETNREHLSFVGKYSTNKAVEKEPSSATFPCSIQQPSITIERSECQVVPCETTQECEPRTSYMHCDSDVQENNPPILIDDSLKDVEIHSSEHHNRDCVGDAPVVPVSHKFEEQAGDGVYVETCHSNKVASDQLLPPEPELPDLYSVKVYENRETDMATAGVKCSPANTIAILDVNKGVTSIPQFDEVCDKPLPNEKDIKVSSVNYYEDATPPPAKVARLMSDESSSTSSDESVIEDEMQPFDFSLLPRKIGSKWAKNNANNYRLSPVKPLKTCDRPRRVGLSRKRPKYYEDQ